MYVSEIDEGQCPQRMRRPEDGEIGKDVDERIEECEKAKGKQGGRKKGRALEALLELRCILGVRWRIHARTSPAKPMAAGPKGGHRMWYGPVLDCQAQLVRRRCDEWIKAAQRQPGAENSGREAQVDRKWPGGWRGDVALQGRNEMSDGQSFRYFRIRLRSCRPPNRYSRAACSTRRSVADQPLRELHELCFSLPALRFRCDPSRGTR